MSRQGPSDRFTRFTSTTPSSAASSRPPTSFTPSPPSSQSNASPKGSTGPPNETPAERVARLRLANRLAKERAAFSPLDRVIARGRTVADAAHRITTYSLLAFTGVASVVAVYGIVSLVTHNRRQKRAWIERELGRLKEAQDAFLRGEADAEQLHLLEQERAGEEIVKKYEADKLRKKQEGFFAPVRGLFSKQTSVNEADVAAADDSSGNTTATSISSPIEATAQDRPETITRMIGDKEVEFRPAAVADSGIAGVALDAKGRPVPANKIERVVRKVEDERRTGEREVTARTGITGGPLDVLAENIAGATKSQSQSWWSWATGGGRN